MSGSNGVIFSIDQLSMQIMWSAGDNGSYGYMYLMCTRPGSGSYYKLRSLNKSVSTHTVKYTIIQ